MSIDRKPSVAIAATGSEAVVAELARVKALFQARTVAAVIGAPMPDAAAFKREGRA